jgi:glycosyltransferase involved in cell wall biosynthesis
MSASSAPRVVLGMTIYNNARYLPEALDSLLSQSCQAFELVLLDDASEDRSGAIAREYEARDRRVRYVRHRARRGMIATWNEVVELADRRSGPEFFAWVSDHDRWHPRWLESLVGELDADPGAVLAYPITRRIDVSGETIARAPRLFDTRSHTDRAERWACFCRDGVGSGDMVYGLMRLAALRQTGRLRRVLRPDRLLIAELTLVGRIRQVREALWDRRFAGPLSIERQWKTLVTAGETPRGFFLPASVQHVLALHRAYAARRAFGLSRATWIQMLWQYHAGYVRRHVRKSEASHAVERGAGRVVRVWKVLTHRERRARHGLALGLRTARARFRRWRRHAVHGAVATARRWIAGAMWVAAAGGRRIRSALRRVVYHALVLSHSTPLRKRARRESRTRAGIGRPGEPSR